MNDCVFCRPAHEHPNLIADSPAALVMLHEGWAVRGHIVVAAKKHIENLSDLEPPEFAAFMRAYQDAERAVLDATGADRAVIMKLGLQVPHVHLHIYPVSRETTRAEVMDAIEGRRRVDPDPDLISMLREKLK